MGSSERGQSNIGSFFYNDTATTEIYTLSLHDALPICDPRQRRRHPVVQARDGRDRGRGQRPGHPVPRRGGGRPADRKSTRLNSSHANISYAVFCLKKKKSTFHFFPSLSFFLSPPHLLP